MFQTPLGFSEKKIKVATATMVQHSHRTLSDSHQLGHKKALLFGAMSRRKWPERNDVARTDSWVGVSNPKQNRFCGKFLVKSCGKPNDKAAIWWFIEPIYGDFGDGLMGLSWFIPLV